MTDDEFRRLVRSMRSAQKTYFKERSQQWLEQSKDLERQVDKELKRQPGEQRLFDADNGGDDG